LRAGEPIEAGQLFRDAARLAPDKAAPQLALAAALKEVGEVEQALLVLRETQKLPSAPPSVAMMIAECQVKLGLPEEALQSLRQGLYRSRQPGVVHQRLGDVLISLEKFPEAIEEYRAAVLRRPELRERQPELIGLIEKAQAPDQSPEVLAKQIQAIMASVFATGPGSQEGQLPTFENELSTPAALRRAGRRLARQTPRRQG
jgi:tetratricopeptide (TPR) repeat protein